MTDAHQDSAYAPASNDPAAKDSRPVQYRVGTLMLFMLTVAASFGISKWLELGWQLPAFVIGFGTLLALTAGMMVGSRNSMAVVYKTETLDKASLIRDYLSENGITATIREGHLPGFTGIDMHLHEVLVAADVLQQAVELVQEKMEPM